MTQPEMTPGRRVDGQSTGREPRGGRAIALAGGVVAALALWAMADPLLGVDLLVDFDGQTMDVGAVHVLVTSLVAGLAGWGLLVALERLMVNARRTFVWAAVAVTVLSLGPTANAVTPSATVVLVLLHLVVAAVVIPGLAATCDR